MDTNIVFLKNKTLYDTLIEIKGSLSFKIELIKNDINKNLPVFEEKNLQYPIKVEHLIEKINIFLLKQKYENQSKIKVSKYNLDCNSRNFSFNEKK